MLRYLVERIHDGLFLELEFDIDVDQASKKLCGYGAFSGKVAPDVGGLRNADGSLIIDPGATYIHEEADGIIRGTWIVTRSEMQGDDWKIEGAGFTKSFDGRPFEGEYWGVRVDPIAAARHVVTHAQGFAGADIGITLTGSSSVRVGTDSDLLAASAKTNMDAKKRAWDQFAKPRKALEARIKALSKPHDDILRVMTRDRRILSDSLAEAVAAKDSGLIASRKALVEAKDTQIKNRRTLKNNAIQGLKNQIADLEITEVPLKDAYEAAKSDYDAAKEKASKDDGAWKMLWWDTPDCLDLIQEAIAAAGYEWYEWSGWNADRSKVLKEIRCVPVLGKKRTDLAFNADNILDEVTVEDDSGEYANVVIAHGAGEGKGALRVTVGRVDGGRPRKPYVLDAKHVTKESVLRKLADDELARRIQHQRISSIRVDAGHSNARRGTYGIGDQILVDHEGGWVGRTPMWCRIVELDWVDLDTCDIFF